MTSMLIKVNTRKLKKYKGLFQPKQESKGHLASTYIYTSMTSQSFFS